MPKDPKPLKIEYHLVSAETIEDLETIVNEQIDDGWEPLGGLALHHFWHLGEDDVKAFHEFYLQALIRKKK
jgi:hypothetical protein